MDTLFRVLYLHLRSIWLRTRALFFSIRFYRLRTTNTSKNATILRSDGPIHYGDLVGMTNAELGVVVRICGLSKARRNIVLARTDAVTAIA
jgi:hypothetical protein